MPIARTAQLVISCLVLGIGVAMLLKPALGSDGYSTLINGMSLATGISFGVINLGMGVVLVALAWWSGRRPALGTVVQPVVVGFTVSSALDLLPELNSTLARISMLAAAFLVLAFGVAGYLGSRLGAGPSEALALAWDPPVPFRWSYSIFQGLCGLIGWLLGAAIGPGTLLVVLALGPFVDLLGRKIARFNPHDPVPDKAQA